MSWTATVANKGYNNGELVVTVLFTDGAVTPVPDGKGGILKYLGEPTAHQREIQFRTSETVPDNWLDTNIQQALAKFAALDVVAGKVAVGTTAVPVVTPPPIDPPPPTQDEIDRAEYAADVRLARRLNSAQQIGVTIGDLVAVQKRLTDNFKSGYEDLF